MAKNPMANTKKTPEAQVGNKGKLPKVGHSGRKMAAAPLPAKAPEKSVKAKALPGKSPGAKMGAVAKAANRGTR